MARSANVLIVDDDPALRQTMETIVRAAGMNSFTAATGEEALDAVKRSPVDVMLLDVQLPGISGLHVLRQVRERHPDIGVIMVSVVKEIPVAVEAIKHGALDYVTKDFSPGGSRSPSRETGNTGIESFQNGSTASLSRTSRGPSGVEADSIKFVTSGCNTT
jgi:DNA-binding NtrC family response regulator